MSAPNPLPEGVRRDLERMAGPLAERMLPPRVTQSATTRNVVAAVNDDGTVDVMMGGAVMQRVPATTACDGVAAGDEVIVERYGPRLFAIGVVAKSLDSPAYANPIKVLWENAAGYYMTASQTCSLSEPVSEQARGIVLHWQGYTPGQGIHDYQHNYTFIPKTHVQRTPGKGVGVLLMADSRLVTKYIYVGDTKIDGRDQNAASDTISGISIDNRYQVLTEVLGV